MDEPRPPGSDPAPGWVGELYDDLLADVLLEREDTGAEVGFLVRELCLRPGRVLFDQGCGIGSLAVPLARLGVRVVGVDQAARYVERARRAAEAAGVAAEFHVGNAETFQPCEQVDAAISWWTSWGHAPDDAGNLAMFRRVHEALAPGGRFALDTMNVPGVLKRFETDTHTRRIVPRAGGEVRLHRTSAVDMGRGFLLKTWTYRLPDGSEVRHRSAMRLYMPWQVAAMLREAGFATVELRGGLHGEELTVEGGRLVALATKRAG